MAKRPKQPNIRIGWIVGGALSDAFRRSLAVVPMGATAMGGPWLLVFAITRGQRDVNVPAVLATVTVMILALGTALQTWLVAWTSVDLKPTRPNWNFDLASAARRFAGNLVLNLISLTLALAGTVLFGGILLFLSAVVVGIYDAITHQRLGERDSDALGWVVAAFVLGAVVPVVLLSRWSVALPVAHIEGLGPANALRRSAAITTGHRLRISITQAGYLVIWMIGIGGFVFATAKAHLDNLVIVLFAFLGLFTAIEALAKVRLYRELATVNGTLEASNLADLFE